MSVNIKQYSGLLSLHSYGEADDILFLSSLREPLAQELEWMDNKRVTVRYWITDQEVSKDQAMQAFIESMCGSADVSFGSHYSEITGYLWTDEELNVGGHSLMDRLKSAVGKWVHLEIEVHP